MKTPGKRVLARLRALPLLADIDATMLARLLACADVPASFDGLQAIPRRHRGWLERGKVAAKAALLQRWHHLRPLLHAQYDLRAFRAGMLRWLRAVHDLDLMDKDSVLAAESAIIALVMRAEDGPLVYCADFAALHAGHLGRYWSGLDAAVRSRIVLHAQYLLTGREDSPMRTLPTRIMFRSTAFGLHSDYLKHMSKTDYEQVLRNCRILADQGAAAMKALAAQG